MADLREYEVAEGIDTGDLQRHVERLIKLGYAPVGGISQGRENGRYYQGMVLRITPPPNGEIRIKEPSRNRR